MKKRHIIVGASAAGMGVLAKLRALAPEDTITCIAAQSEMPFNTCLLADLLATGVPPKGLYTRSESFFRTHHLDLKLNTFIVEIDRHTQRITDHQGVSYHYDTLFIGTGTRPRALRTDFTARAALFQFHTLSDVVALETFIQKEHPRTALVVGAGLSGVECSDALTARGIGVTLLDPAARPLSLLINQASGDLLIDLMAKKGTSFYPQTLVRNVLVDPLSGKAVGVALNNGIELYADMVIAAIGGRPNSDLCSQVSPSLQDGALMVTRTMHTSAPNVYAGGDTAMVFTSNYVLKKGMCEGPRLIRTTTWPDAMQHGIIAAHAMAEKPIEYAGATVILSSHFYDTQVVSYGAIEQESAFGRVIEYEGENWRHTFVLSGHRLAAFSLLGNIRNVGVYRRLVSTEEAFDEKILDPLAEIAAV